MGTHVNDFDQWKLNENDDLINKATLLLQMSAEKIENPMDFAEYVIDYYENPSEYDIDEDSEYYDAISTAYWEVKDHFRIDNAPSIKNSRIYQAYLKA